jgi:hypothetical protein
MNAWIIDAAWRIRAAGLYRENWAACVLRETQDEDLALAVDIACRPQAEFAKAIRALRE